MKQIFGDLNNFKKDWHESNTQKRAITYGGGQFAAKLTERKY